MMQTVEFLAYVAIAPKRGDGRGEACLFLELAGAREELSPARFQALGNNVRLFKALVDFSPRMAHS